MTPQNLRPGDCHRKSWVLKKVLREGAQVRKTRLLQKMSAEESTLCQSPALEKVHTGNPVQDWEINILRRLQQEAPSPAGLEKILGAWCPHKVVRRPELWLRPFKRTMYYGHRASSPPSQTHTYSTDKSMKKELAGSCSRTRKPHPPTISHYLPLQAKLDISVTKEKHSSVAEKVMKVECVDEK